MAQNHYLWHHPDYQVDCEITLTKSGGISQIQFPVKNKELSPLPQKYIPYLEKPDQHIKEFDFTPLSKTYTKVITTLLAIPKGTTWSYQELATRCGIERGARVAGTAMAKNPFPLIFPCHRVVRKDGKIGHYSGGNGQQTKEALLKQEGVK